MKLGCIFCLILLGCESSYNFKNVNYTYLFDDNSSKVWLVDRVIQNNIIISQFYNLDKDVLIFHHNGQYQFSNLKSFGRKKISTGDFNVNSEKLELTLTLDSLELKYNLIHLSEDSILMNRIKQKNLPEQQLKLIPLPVL